MFWAVSSPMLKIGVRVRYNIGPRTAGRAVRRFVGQVTGSNPMGTVYILKSLVNGRYYIGSTNDLKRRIQEHNSGKSRYTKLTKPFQIVFSQPYETLSLARKIEYRLKKLKRRDIIERIISEGKILMGT